MTQAKDVRLVWGSACRTHARFYWLGRVHGWGGSGTLTRLDFGEGYGKSSFLEKLALVQKGLMCGGRVWVQ